MAVRIIKQGNRLPRAVAGEALDFNDIVAISATGTYIKADMDVAGKFPAVGVVTKSCISGGYPEVSSNATIGGLTAKTVGAIQYGSKTAGGVVEAAPSGAGTCVQQIGVAYSATVVVYNITQSFILAAA